MGDHFQRRNIISTSSILLSILQLFTPTQDIEINQTEVECLATNVYYEAKSESLTGQYAVAAVTVNRTKNPNYPSSVCGVIQQSIKSKNRQVCAFSWYCDISKREVKLNSQATVKQYETATRVAVETLYGDVKDPTRGATHFHNPYQSQPSWRDTMIKTYSIGNHDFFKPRK